MSGLNQYVCGPQGTAVPLTRQQQLERVVAAMRELHRPIPRGEPVKTLVCRECRHDWPCDTAWKLDGLGADCG